MRRTVVEELMGWSRIPPPKSSTMDGALSDTHVTGPEQGSLTVHSVWNKQNP